MPTPSPHHPALRTALTLLTLAGCADAPTATPPDAAADAPRPDASAPLDAVPVDAATLDAVSRDAVLVDAAPVDATPLDTATQDTSTLDAPLDSTRDASTLDAPSDAAPFDATPLDVAAPDATPPDTSPLDAPSDATPLDAAPRDAGSRDASEVPEASTDVADVGCAGGLSRCGDVCVDLRTDASHCGACGNRCGGSLVCRGGRCECGTPRGSPGTFTRAVRAGGEERRYRVFVPPGYDRAVATPALVVYHGLGMTPDEMAADTNLDAEAAAHLAIVAYPEGRYFSWNASICCPLATTNSVDDVAFFDALLADLSATFCVDPRRVGLAGYSNGAMMVQRIACQRASVVASVSAVSGPYDGSCAPSRPVPILYAHALDDTRVPYDGGTFSGLAGVFLPSVGDTLSRWRAFDRCGSGTTTWLTVGDTTCFRFNGCAEEVSHCRVGSGGHRWPRPPQAFSASPTVMDFFRRHPLP